MGEDIKLAFQGIWSHKLRSLLTMLGIIIGIASIISIISTIKGTNEQIKENLVGAGNNTVTVQLYQSDSTYEMQYTSIPDGVPVITDAVRTQIKDLAEVQEASLYTERTYVESVYYQNTAFNGTLRGVDPYYLDVYGYEVTLGRGFSENDFSDYRKVVLVDESAAASLFSGETAVGKVIEIAKEPYVVIGVINLSSENEPVINSYADYSMYIGSSSGVILVPSVQWPVLYRYDEPQNVAIKAVSTDDMTSAGQKAQAILNGNLTVSDDSNLSYKSNDISEQAANLQSLTQSTNMQLVWIAGISLIVGGIGVMNIMLVSVTERTREIGLKKAIGAKEKNILLQFLTEAAVLTSFGGLIGVIAGIILSRVISQLTGAPMAISIGAILLSVIFSMLIGIIAGLLPAVKAAKLNPIDALRRE